MMKLHKSLLWAIVYFSGLVANQLLAQDQELPLWHQLEPGSHSVGFKLLHVIDASEGEGRRVVRVGLWYPAIAKSGDQKMVHGEYVEMSPAEVADQPLETFMNKADRESQGRQFFDNKADSHQESLESAQVAAIHAAKLKQGKFPLVIHSLGRNGNLFQHTILWEYLASHGFVTATIGQYGKNLEDPWMDFTVEDLRYQLNDMNIVLDDLITKPFIDSEKIGVVGHSSGAVLALWMAAERSDIKAVIGLDGSINRQEGRDVFASGIGKNKVSAPFLNLCRWPHDEYNDDYMSYLKGDVFRIGFEKGIHFDFQNWPAYQAFAQATEPSSMAIRSLDEARNLFVSTARFTRLFLEEELNDNGKRDDWPPAKAKELSSGQASIKKLQ